MGLGQATRYNAERPSRRAGPKGGPKTATPAVALAVGSVAAAVWLGWRRTERMTVAGPSMGPELRAGDRLVIWKTARVRAGDIVAATDPRQPSRVIVKRAVFVRDGQVFLLGDNPGHSTDSRQFGPVPLGTVIGRAVYRYAPASRTGRLRGR